MIQQNQVSKLILHYTCCLWSKENYYFDQMIIRRKKYEAESQLIRESRKYPDAHGYAVGDLVLINHSPSSVLKANLEN